MAVLRKSTVLLILVVLIFSGSMVGFAADHELALTAKQEQEVERGKQDTKEMLDHWNNTIDVEEVKKMFDAQGRSFNLDMVSPQGSGSIGSKGDILVTLSGSSSGSSAWVGGHAGIVSEVPGKVVESFGNKGKSNNGVRHWPNNWKNRYKKVKALGVRKSTGGDVTYAASYARGKIGKPYNYNFWNVKTVNSFYCSQLVWRAYYNRGFDLNYNGGAVWPVDLIKSPLTAAYYSQG
ncbi:YiiX/YebB-like N1pC/P60 family cysteine hydrolase [Numidum massiliense]|uniref:YiiX/YebB-like N1pC/P60 family cysteine hydrolase n=1 Tax=Numidum massiliense TaxID=1522315 RepID=UPI0006D57B2E|nr:YiiX/YebB-like N1pC/P60 family cysteine hydrolase [Numidum massiliense]